MCRVCSTNYCVCITDSSHINDIMTTTPLSAHVLLVDINMEDFIEKFAAQLAATAGIAAVVGIPQSSSTNVAAGGIGSIISHRHGGEGTANCSIIANGGEGGGGGGGGSASSSKQTTSGRKGSSSPRGTSGRNIMDICDQLRRHQIERSRTTRMPKIMAPSFLSRSSKRTLIAPSSSPSNTMNY